MKLNASQKRLIERVVNVFETGTIEGKYSAIAIYKDGPATSSRSHTGGRRPRNTAICRSW